jgi:hypothetical protein
MTARLLFVLTILLSAAIQCFVPQPQARAGDMSCSGLIGTGRTVTNIDGNVTVPDGTSCTLSFVNITGNVRVGRDATLLVLAEMEPSSIGGDIEAKNCESAGLAGNVTVGGNVNISSCNGATRLNGFQGPDVLIHGNFECRSNAAPLAWLGTVDKDVHIQSNQTQAASDVSLVSVGGNLNCEGNSPAVTHLHGPSWVDGRSQGQCAGFSTTTTSIATPATPTPCANLATLPASGFPVPTTVITEARDFPAGTFAGIPEFCFVAGYVNLHISPVDQCLYLDFFEVAMPTNWNGRFLFQGGSGTEGTVPAPFGLTNANPSFGLINGYAVATQSGGHLNTELALPTCDSGYGNPNEFYLDPLGVTAFAYQSIEVTTLDAKYLINQFYGDGPHHSYWAGCSTGGRQGMVMSQNFPSFFDGVLAGAPSYNQEAIELSETYGDEQILNVYNASPSLPPLSFCLNPRLRHPARCCTPRFRWLTKLSWKRRCCKLAMHSTASPTVSSTTSRPARRSSIPRPRPIRPAAQLSPYNAPDRKVQPVCRQNKFSLRRKSIKVRETAKDKRSPHQQALSPMTTSPTSRKVMPGTAAG